MREMILTAPTDQVPPLRAIVEAYITWGLTRCGGNVAEAADLLQVSREHATRLRLGEDPEMVMTGLRLHVPSETSLSLLERVDPVLSIGFVDTSDDGGYPGGA